MILRNKKIFILAALFLLVTALTKIPSIDLLDRDLSFQLYNLFKSEFFTNLFAFISTYTIVISTIVIGCLIFLKTKNIYKLITFGVLTILQSGIVSIIQLIIQRPRPFTNNEAIVYLGNNLPISFSFPSAHTTFAFFLAYIASRIFHERRFVTIVSYIVALLVAFSRLYLGAHYILDVTGGAILGILLGMVAIKIYFKISLP
ncbi:MAG: phosphatase PAP2 family protein [Candidatus Dojkabacteria bacterium]